MDLLFVWLIGLLVIALILLWLVCFPEMRSALWRRFATRSRSVTERTKSSLRRSGRSVHGSSRNARDSALHLTRRLGRHWVLLLALALILLLPPALILGLRQHVALDGYDVSPQVGQDTTALVASLLKGEQLVPPPSPPPEVFVTREVEMIRPYLGLASRDWAKLNGDFRQRLLVVFKIMKERYGYDMTVIEGYRSPERQTMLAARGGSVTNAGAYQSYHQYGLAADCAFFRDGKLVITEKDPWAMRGYQLYGQVAEAAGLVWGGSWKMMDLGHVELHKPGMGPHHRR